MKNATKLWTVVLTLAMIVSMMVMPVSAAPENTVTNPGFESEIAAPWVIPSSATAERVATKYSGNYGVYVTHTEGTLADVSKTLYFDYEYQPNKYYYMSAWIMPEAPQSGVSAFIRNVGAYADQTTGSVSMNTTAWTQLKAIYHSQALTENKILKTGIQLNSSNQKEAYNYYADDFYICEIKLNETGAIPVHGILTVTGPETLGLNTSNVALSSGTVTGVSYDDTNSVWEIAYRGMTPLTESTLTLTTAISSTKAIPTFTFTTGEALPEAPYNLLTGIIDYSFENMTLGEYKGNVGESGMTSNETYTVVDAAAEGITAVHGTKVLKIQGASDEVDSMQRFNSIENLLDKNKTYEASFWVKKAGGTPVNSVSLTASAAGTSAVQPSAISGTAVSVVPTDEWHVETVVLLQRQNT